MNETKLLQPHKTTDNIIFLDIDGVLNRKQDWVNKFYIHHPCVEVLGKIAKEISCSNIVLSSTWRACNGGEEPEFYKHLREELRQSELNIIDVTPISSHTRQEEIEYYVKRHNCGKYLIIDDDESLFPNPKNIPLYLPNYMTGLMQSDIRSAVKIHTKYWRKYK